MADTIFYTLKLKKNKTPFQVFEKMERFLKNKVPARNWTFEISDDVLIVNFNDGRSETFALRFNEKIAEGFCKVYFPLEGELLEDEKKSEFKLFVTMIHSVKSLCSEIKVTDDYNIAEEYFKSLDCKFKFRELDEHEKDRLDRLYKLGFTNYEDFLLAVFAEDLALSEDFEWRNIINKGIKIKFPPFPFISSICEYYLYETVLYKKKTLAKIYEETYSGADDTFGEVYAFILGVGSLFHSYKFMRNTYGCGVHVSNFYDDKFKPMFEIADTCGKCELAYRFMLSVLDFCRFKFVGKGTVKAREKYDSSYKYLSSFLPDEW